MGIEAMELKNVREELVNYFAIDIHGVWRMARPESDADTSSGPGFASRISCTTWIA